MLALREIRAPGLAPGRLEMDIPYAGGNLLDIMRVRTPVAAEPIAAPGVSDARPADRRMGYTAEQRRTADLCGSV